MTVIVSLIVSLDSTELMIIDFGAMKKNTKYC